MQGKGLVKFFLAALLIVSLYQLSFTWVANGHEKAAQRYAEENADKTLKGEDSIYEISGLKSEFLAQHADENIYNLGIVKYNYDEVKARSLNLGLDLQGGMSVVLEVSKYDLVKQLCNEPKNPKFLAALDKARVEDVSGDGELIDNFVQHYIESNPGSNLAPLFYSADVSEDLPMTASNDQVKQWLHDQASAGISQTYTRLKQRIDKFGVSSPFVTLQANTGRIMVELPGVDNPKRARELLQSTANLEFWRVWPAGPVQGFMNQANNVITALEKTEDTTEMDMPGLLGDSLTVAKSDSLGADSLGQIEDLNLTEDKNDSTAEENTDLGPIESMVSGPMDPAAVYSIEEKDTSTLMNYLRMDEVMAVFPSDLKFMLGAKPYGDTKSTYQLYAIKTNPDDDLPLLDGSVIKYASPQRDQITGRLGISMTMNHDGSVEWQRITGDNVGKPIAIALDNKVFSAPTVQGEIAGGHSQISGDFSQDEAELLASILEVGKLPVPSRIIQEDIVGPSLGAESIRTGIISMIAGLLLVVIFMAFYYSTAGLIADLALMANIFFIFGVLASIGATLTLPGIAGLVLTMGMAVDANVIIYERVREELAKGKSMVKAIADGYTHSYSAIIDSHVTTFIIGIILNYFGSGSIKGFAVVLMIGIIFSLFTAIFISRLILDWMAKTEKPIRYYTNLTKGAFKNVNFKFMQKRRYGYMFSGGLTVLAIIFIMTSGFNYGVEFQGGRSYTVRFEQPIKADLVRDELSKKFDNNVQVKTFSSSDKLKITTTFMIGSTENNADSIASHALYDNLKGFYSPNIDYKIWDATYKESQMKVEPTMAEEIKTNALWAIGIALLCTFIYIVLRFRRWQFGFGAVVALIHDAFMTLAVFSILKNALPFTLHIDETFVAAILTIIGYSIMDTVVVFDRIREFMRESKSGTLVEVFNHAINQTLSRTVITSGVTILSVLAILIFGTDNIQGFAFAMVVGIAFGTYSSVFIASAIAVDLYKKEHHHKSAEDILK